jgi:group II intron reverse transcriptase/maturase
MKESHIEDLVNHDDLESCVHGCKIMDEALTEAHIGRVLSCENRLNQDADAVVLCGKQYKQARYDECLLNPAQSKTSRMYGNPMHENRETPLPPSNRTRWEGEMPKPTMHGNGESDSAIVPVKRLNKVGQTTAEDVEGRELTKGNASQQNMSQALYWNKVMSSELDRIRYATKRDKDAKFTALLHHITIDRLRRAFFDIKRQAAPGVDGETWGTYAINWRENLKDLHQRTQNGGYKAKPSRRVYIPKEKGKLRALGVAALEDKIFQRAVVEILNAIYEVDFLGFSYGYRPNKNPHQALDALAVGLRWKKISWVLDADICGFYDNINHENMMKFIKHRVADNRMLRLIQKWLNAGIIEKNEWRPSEVGAIQGASLSPLLSNIYLHYTLDTWMEWWRKKHAKGDVICVRWADDFVVGFQYQDDANTFRLALNERLKKFSLELNQAKTKLIRFGRFAKRDVKRLDGQSKPKTFDFLGMTHICGQNRNGKFQVVRKTNRKRLTGKLKAIKAELRKRMHDDIKTQGKWLKTVMQGYFNYHAIPGNMKALETFRTQIAHMWYKSLRRRSQKTKLIWKKMNPIIHHWLPKTRILHPWPEERLQRYITKVRA